MKVLQNTIKILMLFMVSTLFSSCVQKHYHITNKTENISTLEIRMEELRSLLQSYEHTNIDIKNISIYIQDDAVHISFQNNILFDLDKYRIKEKYKEFLNLISNYLLENPTLEVTVEGHTDSSGKEDYNLKLSKKRAISVKNILVEFFVDSNRIDTIGYGEKNAKYDNDTREGRQKNRRAEILIRESIDEIAVPTASSISKSSYSDKKDNPIDSDRNNYFSNKSKCVLKCFFKTFGSEACGAGAKKIAKKLDINAYSVITSPSCELALTKLMGEEQSGLDAGLSVVSGLAEDLGMDTLSLWIKGGGLVYSVKKCYE